MAEKTPALECARAAAALIELVDAAERAGEIALAHFCPGERTSAHIAYKEGNSPVTAADLAVDEFLRERCARRFPDAGWLSEETSDGPARLKLADLVIADPIDGTRAFMSGDPRWCIALAYISQGRPIAGVVHAPSLATTYAASLDGGATCNGRRIFASKCTTLQGARIGGPKPLVLAVAEAAHARFEIEPRIPSLALRLARVAEGELDCALASAASHDWDVAAADILLAEAGGALWQSPGGALSYNRPTTRLNCLAAAALPLLPRLAEALARSRAAVDG